MNNPHLTYPTVPHKRQLYAIVINLVVVQQLQFQVTINT